RQSNSGNHPASAVQSGRGWTTSDVPSCGCGEAFTHDEGTGVVFQPFCHGFLARSELPIGCGHTHIIFVIACPHINVGKPFFKNTTAGTVGWIGELDETKAQAFSTWSLVIHNSR